MKKYFRRSPNEIWIVNTDGTVSYRIDNIIVESKFRFQPHEIESFSLKALTEEEAFLEMV